MSILTPADGEFRLSDRRSRISVQREKLEPQLNVRFLMFGVVTPKSPSTFPPHDDYGHFYFAEIRTFELCSNRILFR